MRAAIVFTLVGSAFVALLFIHGEIRLRKTRRQFQQDQQQIKDRDSK